MLDSEEAKNELKEKIEYELFLFDYILQEQSNKDVNKDEKPPFNLVIDNENGSVHVYATVPMLISISENEFLEVIKKFMPLTFVTCFKIFDMIFEWILEYNPGEVPWPSSDKIKKIRKT